jgi:ArsR family transcriptional regulator
MDIGILSNLFKAVGDPVRLRVLHLLAVEELTVGELVRILDLPQSTVSRHLKVLRESALAADRPVGAATFYRAAIEAGAGNGDAGVRDSLAGLLRRETLPPAARRRLDRILALRAREGSDFFDKVGLRWDALRESCFGPAFHLEAFIRLLPADWVVADLGTGTGYLLPILGGHFRRVIGVDMSESMLALARGRLEGRLAETVELRHGALESLPIADAKVDLAVALLMLHHLAEIRPALREMRRILKRGGCVLIVEIHPHANEKFRIQMADRHMGIAPEQLAKDLKGAGLTNPSVWNYPYIDRPEHELAPIPGLYGVTAGTKKQMTIRNPGSQESMRRKNIV